MTILYNHFRGLITALTTAREPASTDSRLKVRFSRHSKPLSEPGLHLNDCQS